MRAAEKLASAGGIGLLVVLGAVTGPDVWVFTLDWLSRPLVVFEGSVSVVVLTLIIGVTGIVVLKDVWSGVDHARVNRGPEITAVVPAYRDAEVVDIAVESLVESDYEDVSIAVATEPDDPETQAAAEELSRRHPEVEVHVNADPGSKGKAVNHVVEETDSDYYAVFDADERVSPEFLSIAMGALLDGADVFQGRRVPRATGAVETLAYCERLAVHMGYAFGELVGFTNCLSASTAFKREAFEEVGGYRDRLTEDLEFAHSCYRAGLDVRQDRATTNTMEAPHSLKDLWGQRKRWRIGHVQVFNARLTEALEGNIEPREVGAVSRASGAIVGGALLLVGLAQVAALVSHGSWAAFAIPFGAAWLVVAAVWAKDARDGRIGRPYWTVVLLPLVYLGHGALTVKSLMEYYLTWEGEWYQVSKTGA
ncbi:MAG: glycosyltransferase [Halobacteriales archaeon]